MKLRRNKIWVFVVLCNPPTRRFPATETPCSKTWRLLGCGPPLDNKIISVSVYNLMSIPIDPEPRLYVPPLQLFSFFQVGLLSWSPSLRFYFVSKDSTSCSNNKGFGEKNLQILCFLTFRALIHPHKLQKTMVFQQESYPKSTTSVRHLPVPI